MKKVVVIGAGYVGLVTAACFAKKGSFVTVVENNHSKVEKLLAGSIPFYEPGLAELVTQGINEKKLVFVSSVEQALPSQPELIFSCVGTPSLPDGSVDMSYVWNVMESVANNLEYSAVIVNKSTVPVGTAQKVTDFMRKKLAERKVDFDVQVASNPEFLREGCAVYDFINPDRIVLGLVNYDGTVTYAQRLLEQFYVPFVTDKKKILVMNAESAELTKYAANTMLATRISFVNELSRLAEAVGADIEQVAFGMGLDTRIGPSFLKAGVGYGGSCFPKDVKAFIDMGKQHGICMSLATTVEDINNQQRLLFAQKVISYYRGNLTGKTIGIWGLAFKPETDDIRAAPALDIMHELLQVGARLVVYDPVAMEGVRPLFASDVVFASDAVSVVNTVDSLLILTEWKEFLQFDVQQFDTLRDKTIFDGRNCLDAKKIEAVGVSYFCIGKQAAADFIGCDKRALSENGLY